MKRLIIVGAGGMGREIADYLLTLPGKGAEWQLAGFLDRDPDALAGLDFDIPILGDPADYQPSSIDVFVCGLGLPSPKRRVVETLLARGAHFYKLIHPTAVVSSRCQIGVGSVICPYAVVSTQAVVGRFVLLNTAASVCHDARIGDFSSVCCHADITGQVELGEEVFIGSHGSIIPGVHVGDQATVGAGSAVIANVSSGCTVVGVPARVLKTKS
ncbi:MAG: acetyltransferase [Bryobacteraceae bacterium]|nr:acetyltransferase [Bryobacteraceae bacterium]